jgi:transposase-like protein
MVNTTMNLLEWLRNQLEEADTDLLREMMRLMAQMLMDAEVSSICGAEYRERSDERVNSRNGHRQRPWDTRVGTIDLEIPKLRQGSYYPAWLLEPRRRAEKALICVVADAWLAGVFTRRVDKLVKALGIEGISRSQVSRIAKALDEMVGAFRNRPLTSGPHTYLWLDALTQKVCEGGRVVNVSCVIAIAVNAEGHREVLGVDLLTTEDGAGWTAFLRGLVARGLTGVSLVISDAHPGLVDAIAACLPGAGWQRCRTHFARNLLCKVPKASQDLVATCVRTIFAQPDDRSVYAQHQAVVEQLEARFPEAEEMLAGARDDISLPSPRRIGVRSGPTTPWSGSTARCAGAPTWWASFPTGHR